MVRPFGLVALANADEPKNIQAIELTEPLVSEMFVDLVSPPKTFARLACSSTLTPRPPLPPAGEGEKERFLLFALGECFIKRNKMLW
jgi:hypothetical protein